MTVVDRIRSRTRRDTSFFFLFFNAIEKHEISSPPYTVASTTEAFGLKLRKEHLELRKTQTATS